MSAAELVVLGPNRKSTRELVSFCQEEAKRSWGAVEVRWVDSGKSQDELAAEIGEAEVIVPADGRALTTELCARLPRLRLVQTPSAGTDYLDKAALGEMGIRVANNGGGNAIAVAEHTIALMISVYRKIDRQMDSLRAGDYKSGVPGDEGEFHNLVDKTVGIIGLGQIGSRVARRLRGWECRLLYYDIAHIPEETERELKVQRAGLDELLSSSDIVTIHVPLERNTYHLIGERELGLMKPTAVLINAARGPVVDETALARALEDKRIFGAGLDVLEEEPASPDNPLFHMPDVVITPHLAGFSVEARRRSAFFSVQNAVRLASGRELESVVQPV
ncbi:MAG: 2-hydroxyacid dehydrogenase [Chloroflexota bacterium]